MTRANAGFRRIPTHPSVVVPEDDVIFRLAQLLLLLESLRRNEISGATLERLSYYDFLVANPLLVLTNEDDPDRLRLLMVGFDSRALMYASPSQRFTSRRERLQHDLSHLVAYGLATPQVDQGVLYSITQEGRSLADRFTAIYSRAYYSSADILVKRLSKLSDKRLRENAQDWISVSARLGQNEIVDALYGVDLLGVLDDSATPEHYAVSEPAELRESDEPGGKR